MCAPPNNSDRASAPQALTVRVGRFISTSQVCIVLDMVQDTSDSQQRYEIAQAAILSLLADQLSRSDSLNSASGALAGLAGVETTLAGIVPGLTVQSVGLAGISAAGLSAVLAVVALATRRPGREPVDIDHPLERILDTVDVGRTLDVLLFADVAAAKRNDKRLRAKGALVILAAFALALAVILIVTTMIVTAPQEVSRE